MYINKKVKIELYFVFKVVTTWWKFKTGNIVLYVK